MKLYDFNWLKGGIEKKQELSKELIVNFIQSELHEALNSFLNGGFSRKGFLLYPLIKDVSGENSRRLNNIIYLLNCIDMSKFSNLRIKKSINRAEFAEAVCYIYKNIEFNGKITARKEKRQVKSFNLIGYNKEDKYYLSPIEDIRGAAKKELRKYALGFYLHGSLATNDYIKGWSDADTMLVLKKSAFESPKNLLKISSILYHLREKYCRIDPLQHHGTMAITEFDLIYYPEAFLPIDAFNCSKSLLDNDKSIKFNVRDSEQESLSKLLWVADYFKNLDESKIKSPYELKFALHLVTLFPSLYLQIKNMFLYKKYSFAIAEKDFSREEWKVIRYVEKIRNEWSIKGAIPFLNAMSRLNPIPAYLLNSRYLGMRKGIKISIDNKFIIDGMKKLSQKAMQKLNIEND